MATEPKPIPPEEEKPGDGKMIEIDIYEMEMQTAAPHWLDPMVKYKGKHAESRRRRAMEYSKEVQKKRK